jgi:hypothetical protein
MVEGRGIIQKAKERVATQANDRLSGYTTVGAISFEVVMVEISYVPTLRKIVMVAHLETTFMKTRQLWV